MLELLALMWSQLKNNTALAFIAVILIAGSNSFVAYESSRTNINIEKITNTMADISKRSAENSKMIAKTQRDMLTLQKQLFDKDWEQDKVISQIYRDMLKTDGRVDQISDDMIRIGN